MKVFQLRDERIVGDILTIYLIAENKDRIEMAFQETCQHCYDRGIDDIFKIAEMLAKSQEFEYLKVDEKVSFVISGEHPDEEKYYEYLKENGVIEEGQV